MDKINPYNFVPLGSGPKRGSYKGFDRLHSDYYSGVLHCKLHVINPLITIDHSAYISHTLVNPSSGLPVLATSGKKKGKPWDPIKVFRFLRNSNSDVIIQGSSLKGMIRAVYEAMVDACLPLAATRHSEEYSYDDLGAYSGQACNSLTSLCPACQLFGTIEGDEIHCQGRVRFTDAVLTGGSLTEQRCFLKELSSPKPRHFPTYGENGKPYGKIAGRKFYYHHAESPSFKVQEENSNDRSIAVDEYAPKGAVFSFQIHIHDLQPEDLGKFLRALELDRNLGHKLGVGKSIGLGSCSIKIIDKISNLYLPLQHYGQWKRNASSKQSDTTPPWRKLMANPEDLPAMLRELLRLDKKDDGEIGYPTYQDYKRGYAKDPIGRRGIFGGHTKVSSGPPVPPPEATPKPIQKGQVISGQIFARGDRWIAKFPGDEREAVIVNVKEIPQSAVDGESAEFYIIEQSKRVGIKARFERILS